MVSSCGSTQSHESEALSYPAIRSLGLWQQAAPSKFQATANRRFKIPLFCEIARYFDLGRGDEQEITENGYRLDLEIAFGQTRKSNVLPLWEVDGPLNRDQLFLTIAPLTSMLLLAILDTHVLSEVYFSLCFFQFHFTVIDN